MDLNSHFRIKNKNYERKQSKKSFNRYYQPFYEFGIGFIKFIIW